MPAKTSHADTFILKQGAIVFSHRGQLEGGHPFYLYIAVRGDKLAEYNALLNKPSPPSLQVLEKIGVILAFGEGEPSAEEMQRLCRRIRRAARCAPQSITPRHGLRTMRFSHLLALTILGLSAASAHASPPRTLQAPDARVYTNVDEYLDSYVEFARILKEHKSTNKSVVVTNSRAEIRVGSTNNYVMDVGFGIYSQLYADMLGFSDVFVSDELPEDILVMSFRQINWGTYSQCYLNIVFRRNPAAHLPDSPRFSSEGYIHHPTHAPQRSKTKKDDASIALAARQKFDASLPAPTKKADYKNPRPWSISIATQDWSIPEKKGNFCYGCAYRSL